MKKTILFLAAAAAASVMTGCASYEQPSEAVNSSSFTAVRKDQQKLLPPDVKYLSLEMAQNLALANNPSFRAKYFAISAARARYYQSFSTYFPTITAGFGLTYGVSKMGTLRGQYSLNRYSGQTTEIIPSVSGQLLLFDSLQREMNVLATRHNWRKSEALEDDARRLLLRSVAYAYNSVMLAAAKMEIALADMKYNADLLKDTELKFAAGAVPLSDVLNFKIRYNNGESSLISAQFDYSVNRYVLAGLLGLTEGTIPEDVEFPKMPRSDGSVLPDISVYLDLALANRPDLKAYREDVEIQKYSYWQSLGAFGPQVTTTYSLSYSDTRYNYNYFDYSADTGLKNRDEHSGTGIFTIGLHAQWNLFNGGADYFAARIAQANMIQSKYALAQQWITVVTDVRTAYENYAQNIKQMKLFQKTFLLTKQTRDLVEEEYRAGSAELTRLNEAQKDLVTAENNLCSAVIEVANAKAQLEAAINVR